MPDETQETLKLMMASLDINKQFVKTAFKNWLSITCLIGD